MSKQVSWNSSRQIIRWAYFAVHNRRFMECCTHRMCMIIPCRLVHVNCTDQFLWSQYLSVSLGDIDFCSSTIYRQTYITIFDNIVIVFFHSHIIAVEPINTCTGMYPSTSVTTNHQRLAERHVQSHHSLVHHGHWQIRFTKYNRISS